MNLLARLVILGMVACCSGEDAAKHDTQVVINEEYGFSVQFPDGRMVCPAMSGDHPHGFYVNLDVDCTQLDSERSLRGLTIWANYNAADWDMADLERLYCDKPRVRNNVTQLSQSIAGLTSRSCLIDAGQGKLVLHVLAERDSAARTWGDSALKGGFVNYRATLTTTQEHFSEDYEDFRRFVSSISLEPFK